jgi:hypothetical protein
LVEIVQTDGLGDAVDQVGVGDRRRDDVGQVELEEIGVSQDGAVGGVGDEVLVL